MNFFETMASMGYKLFEKEGLKLTYVKEKRDSSLHMVIDLEKKYVNAICVPKKLLIYEKDVSDLISEFKELRSDAKYIAERANFQFLGF